MCVIISTQVNHPPYLVGDTFTTITLVTPMVVFVSTRLTLTAQTYFIKFVLLLLTLVLPSLILVVLLSLANQEGFPTRLANEALADRFYVRLKNFTKLPFFKARLSHDGYRLGD